MFKQPLLAESVERANQYQFPCYVSEKLDGVRCLIGEGNMVTRSNHSFKPNMLQVFQALINYATEEGLILDGEIYYPNDDFGKLMSVVSSDVETIKASGMKFYCFDAVSVDEWNSDKQTTPYRLRLERLIEFANKYHVDTLVVLPQHLMNNAEEVEAYYRQIKGQNGEGVMLRSPSSPYQFTRSKSIVKYKVWLTCEAEVVSVHQQGCPVKYAEEVRIENGKQCGYKKTAGSVTVRILPDQPLESGAYQNCTFTGDDGIRLRKEIWDNRDKVVGRIVEFQYLKGGNIGRMARIFRFRPDKEQ